MGFFLQIFPDMELEQQILSLPIRCIHSEEGCRWAAQNKLLQVNKTHTRTTYVLIIMEEFEPKESQNQKQKCPLILQYKNEFQHITVIHDTSFIPGPSVCVRV